MKAWLRYYIHRLHERLWLKPLLVCMLSIAIVFLAKFTESWSFSKSWPSINTNMLATLLEIMASSMLVMATLAVGAMVAALASASNTATPRAFPLVASDDKSQNALSVFVGAFIFSVIGIVALKGGYYEDAGRLTLFCATVFVFALVVLTFVRWVDVIARLGRVSNTIDKVEAAAEKAIRKRKCLPYLGGRPADEWSGERHAIYCEKISYVREINLSLLQKYAVNHECSILLASLPGSLANPGEPVAYISFAASIEDTKPLSDAFIIGGDRVFENDPRFGFIVLSEIAGRALSPGVNDPGTAIDIIGSLVRLLYLWVGPDEDLKPEYDRVFVPGIDMCDLLDDAFTSISSYGATSIEVTTRLQKAFCVLASWKHPELQELALIHADQAMKRAEKCLVTREDIERVRACLPKG